MKLRKSTKILSIGLVALLFIFGVYYFGIYNSVKEISIDCNYVAYENTEDLSNAADLIIVGSTKNTINERKNIVLTDDNDNGFWSQTYTLTNIEIKKIIKSIDKKLDEEIQIIEPFGFVQEFDGKKLIKYDDYEPLSDNQLYLLFLKDNGYGEYSIINMQNGRFNLQSKEPLKNEKYKEFYDSIIKKYENEIKVD